MSRRVRAVLAGVLGALMVVAAAGAARAASYAVILDASAGTARLDAARAALEDVVRGLPEGTRAGLYLYPRPTAEACLPVRELVPLGPLDKAAFTRALATLKAPDGKAPRLLDLEGATRTILAVRERVTAVLVSTGLETCEDDPCVTVGTLKALGVPFELRVVGLKLGQAQAEILGCMARNAGGTYEGADGSPAGAVRRAFQAAAR